MLTVDSLDLVNFNYQGNVPFKVVIKNMMAYDKPCWGVLGFHLVLVYSRIIIEDLTKDHVDFSLLDVKKRGRICRERRKS